MYRACGLWRSVNIALKIIQLEMYKLHTDIFKKELVWAVDATVISAEPFIYGFERGLFGNSVCLLQVQDKP